MSSQTLSDVHKRLNEALSHVEDTFAESNIEFQELNGKTIFRNNGKLYSDLAYGHLIVKLDIQRALLDRKQLLNELNDGLQEAVFPKGMTASHKYRLQWMQNYTQHQTTQTNVLVDSTLSMFDSLEEEQRSRRSTSHRRPKRQLVALGAGLIGGFVSGLISRFQKQQLLDILQQRVDTLVQSVETSLTETKQNEADITRINSTISYVIKQVGLLMLDKQTFGNSLLVLETTVAVTDVVRSIKQLLNAIESVRSGHFTTDIASPTSFKSALSKLSAQALQNGRMIAVKNIMDLNLLGSSYLYDLKKKELFVFCHLPYYVRSNSLTVWKYLPTPSRLSNDSDIFSQIGYLRHNLIAVSDDMSHYIPLNHEELSSCDRLNEDFYCPNFALAKRQRKSCILALYLNDMTMIRQLCELLLTKFESSAHKISRDSYVWSETQPQDLIINCGRAKKITKRVSGTFQLKVKAGCRAFTSTLSVHHPRFEPEVQVTGLVYNAQIDPQQWFDSSIPSHYYIDTANELLSTVGNKVPLSQIHQVSALKHKLAQIKPRLSFYDFITELGPGGLFTQMTSIVVVCVSFYVLYVVLKFVGVRILRRRATATLTGNRSAKLRSTCDGEETEGLAMHAMNPDGAHGPSNTAADESKQWTTTFSKSMSDQ